MITTLREIVRVGAAVYVVPFLLLGIASLVDRTFHTNWLPYAAASSAALLGFAAFLKPYCTRNLGWIRWLPLRARQRFFALLAEFTLYLITAVIVLTLFLILKGGIDWSLTMKAMKTVKISDLRDSIPVANVLSAILVLIVASPLVYIHFYNYVQGYARAHKAPLKSTILNWSYVFFGLLGLYQIPTLTIFTFCLATLIFLADKSLVQIWGTRRLARLRKAHLTLVAGAAITLLIFSTEVWPTELDRPLARIRMYGALAAAPTREWVIDQMQKDGQTEETLRSLAEHGLSPIAEKKRVSLSDIQEISAKTKNSTAFLHLLRVYSHDLWTVDSLESLEIELKKRCRSTSEWVTTQFQTHWACDVAYDGENHIRISVEDVAPLKELLKPDFPILSSLILDWVLRRGIPPGWDERIATVAESRDPVASRYAKLVLKRKSENNGGDWWCEKTDPSGQKGLCYESSLIRQPPLAFRSKLMSGYSRSLRLFVAEDPKKKKNK